MKSKWIQLGLGASIAIAGLAAAVSLVVLGQSAEKKEGIEEGSGMKEDAHKMQEQAHEPKEEGSKM